MSKKIFKKEALDYHSSGRKGKIEVIPSKPHNTRNTRVMTRLYY